MAVRAPELRLDPIHDRAVVIAPKRNIRPHDIPDPYVRTVRPQQCPFCPEGIKGKHTTAHMGRGKNLIRAIANDFPAVSLKTPKAYGYQEVIIDTPNHDADLGELSVSQLDHLLQFYQQRTKEIARIPKMEYILIFKNHGGKSGASLVHAHSQVFATGFVPPHIVLKLQNVRQYKLEHGHCYYCKLLADEKKGPRRILSNRYVTAFAPYASAYPYEVWLFPNRHLDNCTRLSQTERRAFAKALQSILKKLNLIRASYNYYLHQTLTDQDEHFYLRIAPREQTWGGVEVGSRLVINGVAPEDAAKFFRK